MEFCYWCSLCVHPIKSISSHCKWCVLQIWYCASLTSLSLSSLIFIFTSGTAQGLFSVLTAAGNIAPVAVGAFAGEKEGRNRWKRQKCCDLMWYKFVLHSTSSLSLPLSGGQLGSYDLGNVLIFAVSGAYVLSGFLFVLAAIADDKKIEIEWNADKVKWTYYNCMHPPNAQY